jgi:hypothetical protein
MQHTYSSWLTRWLPRPLAALGLGLATAGAAQAQTPTTFAPAVTYGTGTTPQGIALVDINGDGRLDIITANSNSNNVGVLLGSATTPGTFPATATFYGSGGDFPVGIGVSDVNGDGRPDIVVSSSANVGVLLNQATAPGTFSAAIVYSSGNSSPRGLALTDVNRDGRLDIITGGNGNLGVLLNLAAAPGTFGPAATYNTGTSANDIAVGDVNGDGRPDVAVSNFNGGNISLLLNSASAPGTFPAVASYNTGGISARGITLGDVNGDGRLDLVTGNQDSNNISVLLNQAASPGTFGPAALYSSGANGPNGVAVRDMNGDGRPDIVSANNNAGSGSTVSVLLNSATTPGTFLAGTTYNSGGRGPIQIALGDVNGDSQPDITTSLVNSAAIGVLLNKTGYASPTVTISSSAGSSTSFAPIPVSVVFSSAVTDFDATDLAITGNSGTLVANSFRGSGTSYTFSIQPQDVPLVNVALSIATGAAHDAGGNANSAATFSIQYVRPTATTRQGNNNDWFNPTSWDNGVPTRSIDAVVPSGLLAYVGSGNAQAHSLVVGAGANVLQVGGTMELTGNLVSQGSASNGTYLQELLLTGPGNQTINNGQALNLSKLTVGPAGATLNGPLTIRTLLTLKGDLTTNNQSLKLVTNYAASGANPALVDNAGGVVQGPAMVERAINGSNQGLGYRHYSPPVTGATVATLATANFTPEVSQASVYNTSATPGRTVPFPTVYAYDESRLASVTNTYSAFDKGFVVPNGLNAPLVPGQGYAVNIAGTEIVNFVGTLNNNDYPVSLTRVASNADAGWALVGNPYPAILDWDLTTRSGLNDALYVVQSTGQYTGSYSGYVNGVAVNNGSQFVAPGQGFFVRVADGQTNGSVTFTNAARTVTATPTNFQRLTQETRPLLRLTLLGAGLADEAVVYTEAGATPAFDRNFDAAKLPNPTGLNLSSLSAGESLAINGNSAFTAATTLPLSVGVPTAGTYVLTAAALDNLPAGLTAYLRDAQTGQTTKLTAGTSYSFTVSAAEAQALIQGRFTVTFGTQTALATAPVLLAEGVSVYPNPAHNSFTVTLLGVSGASAVQAELVNTLGQVVRRQSAGLPASGTSFSVPTAELAAGVYVLRLQAGDTTLTKRVVVQ